MHRTYRMVLIALGGVCVAVALSAAGCGNAPSEEKVAQPLDRHPATGTVTVEQTASSTSWAASAVQRGPEQGMELHLEKEGKRVSLPDAAPLGFSPDGKLLLLVWTPPGGTVSGLAYIDLTRPDEPHLLTDASRIATPGRAEDIRWDGHRLAYDLPGEEDRLTVSIDLDTGTITTRKME